MLLPVNHALRNGGYSFTAQESRINIAVVARVGGGGGFALPHIAWRMEVPAVAGSLNV